MRIAQVAAARPTSKDVIEKMMIVGMMAVEDVICNGGNNYCIVVMIMTSVTMVAAVV